MKRVKMEEVLGLSKLNQLPAPYRFAVLTEFDNQILVGYSNEMNDHFIEIEEYNTQYYIPSPHFKPISKIVDISKIKSE